MIRKDTLQLFPDINYYVTSDGYILFVEPDKKAFIRQVKSYMSKYGMILHSSGTLHDSTGFTVKCGLYSCLEVSHPKIVNGKFLKLLKSDPTNVLDIFGVRDTTNQVFTGTFELAIGINPDTYEPTVYMVCPEMHEYKYAWEGFVNKVRTALKKKTKTLIPGHRYLSGNTRLVYVGEAETEAGDRQQIFISGTTPGVNTLTGALTQVVRISRSDKVPRLLYDSEKDSTVYLIRRPGLMYDLGESMVNDLEGKNLVDFWYEILESIQAGKKGNFGESLSIDGLSDFIDLVWNSMGSGNLTRYKVEYKSKILPKLNDYVKKALLNEIIIVYMNEKDLVELKGSNSIEENKNGTLQVLTYLDSTETSNIIRVLTKLGVDLSSLAEAALLEYSRIDFKANLETVYKYLNLTEIKPENIRNLSLINTPTGDDNGQFRGLFKSGVVADKYIELLELAKENLGLVSGYFKCFNAYVYHNDTDPCLNITITLGDLIRYLGGLDKIPEDLKNLLLQEDVIRVDLSFKRTLKFI